MAGYIITFRLSNSENTNSYNTRRNELYKYFDGYIPFSTETKENTTSTIFWQSNKEFNKNNQPGEIIYDLLRILNKTDELLIIRCKAFGMIDSVSRIKEGIFIPKDNPIYATLNTL